jgi:hypothetical protein
MDIVYGWLFQYFGLFCVSILDVILIDKTVSLCPFKSQKNINQFVYHYLLMNL